MGVRISGNNITVPGQVAVEGTPTSLQHLPTMALVGTLRAYVENLDLNAAAPIDLDVLSVGSNLYVPVRCVIYNPSGNMSGASLGLYTAAGGGGTAIVAPVGLATLTGTGKFQSLTIAAITDMVTAQTLYPRLTVASGVAGTASLLLEYLDLSLI